jgi:cellulase
VCLLYETVPDTDGFVVDGSATRITLPSDLAPGNYLLRHELTAKHLSPPELFISCSSLVVSGSGSSTPSSSETARFPGAYAATDPGMVVDIFNGPFTFVFPGPPLAAMADGAFAIVPHLSAAGKTIAKGVAAAASSVVKAAPAFNPPSSSKSSSSKIVKTSSTSVKPFPKTTSSAQKTTTNVASKSTPTVTITSIVTSIETNTVTTTKTASPHRNGHCDEDRNERAEGEVQA